MLVCSTCGAALDDGTNYCPHDGTPLQRGVRPWRDPLIGSVIGGRYRVINRLGMGGMAVVYHAQHLTLGIAVALKVLRSGLNGDPRAVARFAREARATGRIDHPNVVQVFDFGCAEQGFYYLVTEFISGTTLADELERARIALPRITHILAQIGVGVRRAHQLGIIHRDLKPGNVMLTRIGSDADHVKLLDFGIARALVPDAQMPALTRAGEVFGTPEYMAPEQWQGRAHDHRVDIYAIGVMAYEMLTGAPPFVGASAVELMTRHLEETPSPPAIRSGNASIPPVLDALVMRCLAKEPADRFASLDELLQELGRAWESLPRRAVTTTYGNAIGSAQRPDATPDPTLYQSSQINVVWDGPLLVEEIRRLHAIRGKRLQELAAALWGSRIPPEASALIEQIADAEAVLEAEGQAVALLRAELDEQEHAAREREADLRVAMIDASFALSAARDRLPFIQTMEPFHATDDDDPTAVGSRPPLLGGPEEVLAWAERRLAAHLRRASHERAILEGRLVDALGVVRTRELELAPLNERLSAIVQRDAARRRELRPLLVSFAKIDGALASFQALLEMIELA